MSSIREVPAFEGGTMKARKLEKAQDQPTRRRNYVMPGWRRLIRTPTGALEHECEQANAK